MQRKAYNTPFWTMLFTTIFVVCLDWITLKSEIALIKPFSAKTVFFILLWPTLLLVETITYRAIRKKIKDYNYVRIHINACALAFVLLPLIFIIISGVLARSKAATLEYTHTFRVMSQIRFYVFWILFIIGHAFFITTIANIFRKNDIPNIDNEQPPGILDGIIDEY